MLFSGQYYLFNANMPVQLFFFCRETELLIVSNVASSMQLKQNIQLQNMKS